MNTEHQRIKEKPRLPDWFLNGLSRNIALGRAKWLGMKRPDMSLDLKLRSKAPIWEPDLAIRGGSTCHDCGWGASSRNVFSRADGGTATAKKGVLWMLAVGVPMLLERLNALLLRACQTPMSAPMLYALVNGRAQKNEEAPSLLHVFE